MAQEPDSLTFKILRDATIELNIEDVCCNSLKADFPTREYDRIDTHYGEGPIWVKIEGVKDSGLIQFTPATDEITLYVRTKNDSTWQIMQTGDIVSNDKKPILTPFMALPLPQNILLDEVYARIVQASKISIKARQWTLPSFAAMQDQDQVIKTFLLGFLCAIIIYNVVVSTIVRDPVFILNAACIGSLLISSLYISGYGVTYFWSELSRFTNSIFYCSVASAILFGAAFFYSFLKSEQKPVAHYWPLFVAPVIAAISGTTLLIAQAPHWTLQLALLSCGGLLFILMAPFVCRAAFNGDRKARIMMFPFFFAMVPGLSLTALNKIIGYDPLHLANHNQ